MRQNGNILFLILLAVVLFATLAYAVTSSMRGGGQSATREKAETGAARIFNYESLLRSTILRMMMSKGVAVNAIRFNNDVYTTIDKTSYIMGAMGSPSDPSLYLFHPDGGNIAPQTFVEQTMPCPSCSNATVASGHMVVNWTNIPEVGTTASDISLYISSLSYEVCRALNEKNGVAGVPNLIVATTGFSQQTVPPALAETTGSTPADIDAIRGKTSFCYKEPTGKLRYNYFIILTEN